MKKLVSIILCMSFAMAVVVFPTNAEEFEEKTYTSVIPSLVERAEADGHAYAYLDIGQGGSENVKNGTNSKTGFTTVIEHDGRYGLKSTYENSNLYLAPQNSFWENMSEKGMRLAVTVEYFDSVAVNSFSVHYNDAKRGSNTSYGAVKTEGTNQWKTYTFYTDNCLQGNFRIRTAGWQYRGYNIEIGGIFVEAMRSEHDVEVTASNGEIGMIYNYGDGDAMTVTIENTVSTPSRSKVNYTVRDREGKAIGNGTLGEISLNAGEKTEKVIHTGVSKLGIYTIDFEVESDGVRDKQYTRTFDFSVLYTLEKGDKRWDMAKMCAHFDMFYYKQESFDVMKRFAFSGFRGDADWNAMEPLKGTYVKNDVFDYVKQADESDIDYMFLAHRANLAYGAKNTSAYIFTDESINGYANFTAWGAKGFGGEVKNVKFVELFNEWNHSSFNSSGRGADGYIEYAKVAYPKIKAANPDCIVVAGGTAGCDLSFIRQYIELGGLDYCDGISVHPYQERTYNMSTMKNQINQLNQLMTDKAGTAKPIYFTEIGFSRAWPDDMNCGMPESERRAFIPQMYLMCYHTGSIGALYYYDLTDDGPIETTREHKWGLFKNFSQFNSNAATDAMAALSPVMKWLPKTEPGRVVDKYEDNPDKTVAYEYKRKDGSSLAALFTFLGNDFLTLKLGCESVKVYDIYGNPIGDMKGDNGVFTFDLTNEITYIEGTFPQFEMKENAEQINKAYSKCISGDKFTIPVKDVQNRNLTLKTEYNDDVFDVSTPQGIFSVP